jgi:hypothetical protein
MLHKNTFDAQSASCRSRKDSEVQTYISVHNYDLVFSILRMPVGCLCRAEALMLLSIV